MKKTFAVVVISICLLGLASQAQAGILFLGIQGGVSNQKASFSGISFDKDATFLYGLKAGVNIMTLTLELNYFQAAHNINTSDLSADMWRNRAVDYSYLGANVRWNFPLLVVRPYITVGYGYYTADIKHIDKDSQGGINAGAGVEIMLGKKISIAAEGKYHHVKFHVLDNSLKVGDFTLTGGLNFHL